MESLSHFGGLLEVLESSQESLGIGHMGLSMPTLVRPHTPCSVFGPPMSCPQSAVRLHKFIQTLTSSLEQLSMLMCC